MSERTINKLRRKFMTIAMLSFILVMVGMGAIIYTTNLVVTRQRIVRTLNMIIENNGYLEAPRSEAEIVAETEPQTDPDLPVESFWSFPSLSDVFSSKHGLGLDNPEFAYSTRYFAVIFDENQEVVDIVTSHIAAVDEDTAKLYGQTALKSDSSFSSFGDYYYEVGTLDNGNTIVVYLDSRDQILTSNRLLYTALGLLLIGALITFALVRYFSFRLVAQEIRNVETQKQFITNASHELKTPLAVIRANTEVEAMLNGENEWNQSTLKQVDRMTGLIQNLVTISRAQEREEKTDRIMLDVSSIVKETADTFAPVASQDNKQLVTSLQDQSNLRCEESEIRQLASLLIDNAIKYCDDGGTIKVSVTGKKRGGNVRLVVSNNYAAGKDVDYSKFFERFYREDESHHAESTKGGYGIGLSIAESLVHKYHGSIQVNWNDGVIMFTCVLKG